MSGCLDFASLSRKAGMEQQNLILLREEVVLQGLNAV